MLFSEIYGSYYRAVSHILAKAVSGELNRKTVNQIVQEEAFGESLLTIPDALLSGQWGLMNADCETALTGQPEQPMTILEKRWLKALLLDPRVRLFQPDISGLDTVEPLFRPEWLVYYDRYTDGDDYEDPVYIRCFRTILTALQQKKQLEVTFTDRKGNRHHTIVSPQYLEYSEKDDRFRLAAEGFRPWVINLSRVESSHMLDDDACISGQLFRHEQTLTLKLIDERNALERVLLHFSHLEKETKRLDDTHYQITIHYDAMDATELLIRVLSFGPRLEVTAPEDFREKIRHRLICQKKMSSQLFFRDADAEL